MAVIGYATVQLIPSMQGFTAKARGELGPVSRSLGTEAGKKTGGLFGNGFAGTVGKIMTAAGIYEIGSRVAGGISDAITTGIKGYANLQTYTISFKTLLGSASKANDMIQQLYNFAAKTPFDVEGSVVGAQKLLGVGVAAKNIVPTLTTLGDATAALGGSTADFNSVLLAYSQIMARGKVSTQDLYQISNTGIPIFQLMSKALGKPVGEIQKLIETGKLASDDVLPKLLDQMNKEYGGAMAGQAQTLTGLWSTFKDTMSQVLTKALTPVGDWLVSILPGATTAATGAIEWLQGKFGDLVSYLQDPNNHFADTFQPLIDGLKNTDWDGLIGSIGSAFGTMWTTVQPILKSLTTVVGDNLPLAFDAIGSVLDGIFGGLSDSAEKAGPKVDKMTDSIEAGARTAQDTNSTWYDTAKAYGFVGSQSVNAMLGALKAAGAILQGQSISEVAAGVMDGQYGPSLKKAGILAQQMGTLTRGAFDAIASTVQTKLRVAGTAVAGWASSVKLNVKLGMDLALASVKTGATNMVAAIGTGTAQFIAKLKGGMSSTGATVASAVSSAVSRIKGFVGSFTSAGAALMDGFIGGIRSRIGAAEIAAGEAVGGVSQYFPHSPAPKGPFSGRGWTLYSGRSLIDGFSEGVRQRSGSLQAALNNTLSTAKFGAPSNDLLSAVSTTGAARKGAYIGTANVTTTNGNAGVIDELNFYLRTLDRGGR